MLHFYKKLVPFLVLFLLIISFSFSANPSMEGLQGNTTGKHQTRKSSKVEVSDLNTSVSDYGSKGKKKRRAWLKKRTIGQRISLADFLDKSNQEELLEIDRILIQLVAEKSDNKNYQEFYKNSEHTRKNWMDKNRDANKHLSSYTFQDFEDLRTDGWFDAQSDKVDVYLTFNFMRSLSESHQKLKKKGIESPLIKELYQQIYQLVLSLLPTYNDSSSRKPKISLEQMNRFLLNPWKTFAKIDHSTELKGFPWGKIAENHKGYSAFDEIFSYSAADILYLNLYKHHLRGAQQVLAFSESKQVQDDLYLLQNFTGKVDLRKIDGGDCLITGTELAKAL
ncbi:hypothetical protein MJH12_19000, partial [bacterium]|nr:hypothetical protein [bacterium]